MFVPTGTQSNNIIPVVGETITGNHNKHYKQ